MKKVIFNGEPGEVWTNETGKAQYQFVAELSNTCGACLSYHMAVSSWWPLPIHRNCRCKQVLIRPGAAAKPFVDFREILDGLSDVQKRAAVGSSVYKLLRKGVINWSEAVAPSRVRTLREVVARGKLSVATMRKAGVKKPIAETAWAAVHTPEHEVVAAHRKALVKAMEGAGATREAIIEAAADALADRIKVAGIDLGGAAGGTAIATPPVIPPGPLVDLLGLDKHRVEAALKKAEPKPKLKKAREPMTPPRSETDAPEFPRSKAEVVYGGRKSDQNAARRWVADVFGEEGGSLIASIVGAPDGAKVTIESSFNAAGIRYLISHPKIRECRGEFRWWGPKNTVHHPIIFEVEKGERGGGFGSRVHGRRVYWGQKMGVARLEIDAGRAYDMNGYEVWPAVGYDGKLPFQPRELPAELQSAKTVQELLSLPGGVAWWREHGVTTPMRFDLTPGSRNVYLWNRHWTKKPRAATGD